MGPLPAGDPLREEILALEAERTDAMVRQDIGALTSLLADDLAYTHSDGRTDTKETFLSLIAAPALRYLAVDYAHQGNLSQPDRGAGAPLPRRRLREPGSH